MPVKSRNGNGVRRRVDRLEEALSTVLTTQASFMSRTAEMDREMAAMRRDIDDMRHMLTAVMQMIEKLPDAVREKVGFRGPS